MGNGDLHLGFCSDGRPDEVWRHVVAAWCFCKMLWLMGNILGKDTWPTGTYMGDFLGCRIHGYVYSTVSDGAVHDEPRSVNQKYGFRRRRYHNGDVDEGWRRKLFLYGHWERVPMLGEMILMRVRICEHCRQLVNGLQHGRGVLDFADGHYSLPITSKSPNSSTQTVVFGLKGGAKMELVDVKYRFMRSICSGPFFDSSCYSFEYMIGFAERFRDLKAVASITDCTDEFLASELPVFQTVDDRKRLGEVISKGHRSYKMVRVLQIGIRYCLRQNMDSPRQQLSPLDFRYTASTQIRIPSEGHYSELSANFKWKDYCPAVFRHLQELDKIDTSDYMLSVCGNETLRMLTSPGKSGSLLYLSQDDRFVIKSMRKSEMKVLLEMLPNYYHHVCNYTNTLLTKFYGLHVVKQSGGHRIYFMVMANIFCSNLHIHKRFDLKGSSHGRCISKVEIDENTTFKDLDLDITFYLNRSVRQQVLTQIKHDCDFLEAEGIMDYSLLLGVHVQAAPSHPSPIKGLAGRELLMRRASLPRDSLSHCTNHQQVDPGDNVKLDCAVWPAHKLGVEVPARAIHVPKTATGSISSLRREVAREPYNVQLYFGIIDILQGYNMRKRIEHAYKSLQFGSHAISAVKPKVYSARFQEFLSNVFQAQDLRAQSCVWRSLG